MAEHLNAHAVRPVKSLHGVSSASDFFWLWLPQTWLLLFALIGTSTFNVFALIVAMPTMVYPRYMISHVILNETLRGAASVIWTLCALVCLFSDVVVAQKLRRIEPKLSRPASCSVACMVVTCVGWVGAAIWDLDEHMFVHALMGSLYGVGFTCRAAIHSWMIDPLRAQSGLPAVPFLISIRRASVLIELAAAPVLLAGLPTLLRKQTGAWSPEEQHLALASSFVEHLVFVHLRLLTMSTFVPDLGMLDRTDAGNVKASEALLCVAGPSGRSDVHLPNHFEKLEADLAKPK